MKPVKEMPEIEVEDGEVHIHRMENMPELYISVSGHIGAENKGNTSLYMVMSEKSALAFVEMLVNAMQAAK